MEVAEAGDLRRIEDGAELPPRHALLTEGVVARMADHPDGRSAISEIFVAPAVLTPGPEGERWMAIGGATYRRYTVLGGEQLARADRLAAEQAELHRAWLEILLFEPARARIAYLLLALATSSNRTELGPVNLSYARIAGLSGVTERSVDRAMAPWLKQGVIERSREGYLLRDLEALRACLGEGLEALDFVASRERRRRVLGMGSGRAGHGSGPTPRMSEAERDIDQGGADRQRRSGRSVQEAQHRTPREQSASDHALASR